MSGHRKPPSAWPSSALISRGRLALKMPWRLAEALPRPQQASTLVGQWVTKKELKTNKRHPPKFESLAGGLGEAPKPHGLSRRVQNPNGVFRGVGAGGVSLISGPSYHPYVTSSSELKAPLTWDKPEPDPTPHTPPRTSGCLLLVKK